MKYSMVLATSLTSLALATPPAPPSYAPAAEIDVVTKLTAVISETATKSTIVPVAPSSQVKVAHPSSTAAGERDRKVLFNWPPQGFGGSGNSGSSSSGSLFPGSWDPSSIQGMTCSQIGLGLQQAISFANTWNQCGFILNSGQAAPPVTVYSTVTVPGAAVTSYVTTTASASTSTATVYDTTTSTLPASTVTDDEYFTTTLPASTYTTIIPASTVTLTKSGKVTTKTLPASTVTSTLPQQTTTVRSQKTVYVTSVTTTSLPISTVTKVSTAPPTTITKKRLSTVDITVTKHAGTTVTSTSRITESPSTIYRTVTSTKTVHGCHSSKPGDKAPGHESKSGVKGQDHIYKTPKPVTKVVTATVSSHMTSYTTLVEVLDFVTTTKYVKATEKAE